MKLARRKKSRNHAQPKRKSAKRHCETSKPKLVPISKGADESDAAAYELERDERLEADRKWEESFHNEMRKPKLVRLFAALRERPFEPEYGWDEQTTREHCLKVVQAGFSGKNLPLACVAVALLDARRPDTVRGTMYAVVSAGWLPDTSPSSYMRVQRILHILRKRGVVPYRWLVDNVRATDKPSSWSGLRDFADSVSEWYRRDYWASLPDYPCVIVEKDTVAGRVSPVTRKYDVPLHPLRGFSSTSFTYGIAEEWRHIEKPIHVYYIGDHDPSGRDIERSVKERLTELSGREFSWKRLAVEPEHFEQFNIIPLKPKKQDTRYIRFAKLYGDRCAEVEAVPADVLRDMVEAAIKSHIPESEWNRLKGIETKEKSQWSDFISKLKGSAA